MKLSVITVNLNNVEGLQKTIESVINQTFTGYEFLVIDGGSSDQSQEIISHFQNKITYWLSEKDNGIYNAMNKGIKSATGDYLLFLNSGDELKSYRILEEVFKIDHDEDIIYGDISYFDPVKKQTMETDLPEKLDLYFFYRQSLWHQAAFIKKELFDKYNGYNENYKLVSDYEFFLKRIIIDKCSYVKINLIVTFYDMYNGISVRHNDLRINEMNNILNELFPLYILELLEDHFFIYKEMLEYRKSVLYRLYRKYNKLRKILNVTQ